MSKSPTGRKFEMLLRGFRLLLLMFTPVGLPAAGGTALMLQMCKKSDNFELCAAQAPR